MIVLKQNIRKEECGSQDRNLNEDCMKLITRERTELEKQRRKIQQVKEIVKKKPKN